MTDVVANRHDASTLARLRRALERDRAELLESSRRGATQAAGRTDGSDGIGETEHLVVAEQQSVSAVLDAMSRAALEEVDAALERFDAGSYGRCVGCGGAIPIERLQAMPAADRCIACQQLQEPTRR